MSNTPHLGSRGKPEESCRAILNAAVDEFAAEGLSGARMDAIAKTAGVNKALLYYYFNDKESLYGAVLDHVFSGIHSRLSEALNRPGTPGTAILRYAVKHFDYLASNRHYLRLVQYEMMRARIGKSVHIERLVNLYFRPLIDRLHTVMEEAIEAGEFRRFDAMQMALSVTGVNVHYFIAAPILKTMGYPNMLAPESLINRREAMLDLLSAGLFEDRDRGREIANQILAEEDTDASL